MLICLLAAVLGGTDSLTFQLLSAYLPFWKWSLSFNLIYVSVIFCEIICSLDSQP